MEDARIPTTEQLMADMAWVRQLARALIRNDAQADDVAQDTWVVAAERQPDADRPLRPWLGRVVGNLVRTRQRSQVRRGERDAAFDADRHVPTPAELVERVELQRAVADEVLALAEPYRSTVLLHFVEGYGSAEIARRLGIPDGTVRRRLKVALDQLRDALSKRTDQPKRGWMVALLPLAKAAGPTPASAGMEGAVMKKVVAISFPVVVLALVVAGVVWRSRSASTESVTVGSGSARAAIRVEAAPADEGIPPGLAIPGAPARRIAGRVITGNKPVAGATVRLGIDVIQEVRFAEPLISGAADVAQPIAQVVTGSDGTFDFGRRPAAQFTVSAFGGGYAPAAVVVQNGNPQANTDDVIIALAACTTRLSGTILDASGGPIANAHVSSAPMTGSDSDASGNYSLCLSPGEGFAMPKARVRVTADGYGSSAQWVLAVGDLRQDFRLVPEAVLVGKVVTSDGEPVPGARVLAWAEPREAPHHVASGSAETDRDGRFKIAGLAPGAFRLSASSHRLQPANLAVVAQPTTTSRELRLVLTRVPLARVSGRVFQDGKPVAGEMVTAFQDGDVALGTVSQADGSFVIDGVPFGPTRLVGFPDQADAATQIDIQSPTIDDVRIDIKHGARAHGHVTRNGKPVAGAYVLFIQQASQLRMYGRPTEARTDASGAFSLVLPAGAGQILAWDWSRKAFAEPRLITVAVGEDQQLDLDLAHAGEARGTVVDEAGTPLPGIYMRLDLANGMSDWCESITNAKGEFDCALLAGGTYRATVTPTPGARQAFASATGEQFPLIDVPTDGAVTGIRLAIKNERLAIRGTIVDDSGAPMPDVRVVAEARGLATMDPPSTLSDENGHFEIENLARGSYDLRAHAADGSEGELRGIAAGTASAAVRIARSGAVEGTLTGFASTPIVLITTASITPVRDAGGLALIDGTTFSRTALAPGRYLVEATAGDDVDSKLVEVHPGETVRIALRPRPVGTVEGTVLDYASRKPVAGMRCDATISADGTASPAPASTSHQATTDAGGHFTVRAPVGQVRINCLPKGTEPISTAGTDVDVAAGSAAKVTVYSVRAVAAAPPSDPSFMLAPFTLPLTVGDVLPNGAAATAGLRVGDRLITIDGAQLQGLLPNAAMVLLFNQAPGSTVTLGIERAGAARTIKLPLTPPRP